MKWTFYIFYPGTAPSASQEVYRLNIQSPFRHPPEKGFQLLHFPLDESYTHVLVFTHTYMYMKEYLSDKERIIVEEKNYQ